MSSISAGTSPSTSLVATGDTSGELVLKTNNGTTAVTIGTNQVVTLAQPLPVSSGGTGGTSGVNLATSVTGTLPVGNGGTGATTLTSNNVILGNGGSAVQFVAPGSSGNVLTSNGTTWTSAAASGGLTLLSTVTADSSSTVDIETGIGSSYDFYLITVHNVTTDSTGIFQARIKIDGSYSTGSNYHAMSNGGYSNGSGNLAYNQSGATFLYLTLSNPGSLSSAAVGGEFWFGNPTNTTRRKIANWVFGCWNQNDGVINTLQGTGTINSTSAWTGIRFYFGSGTVVTGTFRLYGYAK
jgi:hypothetical protein